MNDCFERMKKLLSDTGISFAECGYSNAEIFAYACGVEYVRAYLDDILKTVFINLDDSADMYEYISLLHLRKNDFTPEQLRQRIYGRLGMPFGGYTVSGFQNAFGEIGSGQYKITKQKVVFSGVNKEDLHRLGDFIESHMFVCKDFSYDGNGLTFDERDACNMNFHDCDGLNLPFDIIDTLRRTTNEQYE